MNLTADEKAIIKSSFALLSLRGSKVAEYFYNNLFDMAGSLSSFKIAA